MKNLSRLVLALLALSVVTSFSGAWTAPQEVGKAEKLGQGQGPGKRQVQQKARGEKQAALKKVVPTLKTPLSEAITLAEKETGGKAFSAGVELKDGKPSLIVNLFTEKSDKAVIAMIDPDTKKVTLQEPKKPGAEGEGEGDVEGG
jgi:hypothetical protein